MINIQERLRLGRERKEKDRASEEVKKLGVLRAGMSGIMSGETGDIAGTCHRKTHLRSLGLELEQIEDHKKIMFELGFASEDITTEILEKSLLPHEILLREEEIPIKWQIDSVLDPDTGLPVQISGRPDIVICTGHEDESGTVLLDTSITGDKFLSATPKLGLELKSVHSMWTARDVLFNQQPKMNNLIQSAHYMWKLNVPYKLIYKSYSALGQSMNDWAAKLFPKQGEPLSQYVEYNDKGGIKGLKQFEIVYDLKIDDRGRVCYKLEEATEWTRTIITTQDIERFYTYVSSMAADKQLGPRPMTIDAHGEKLNYKDCQYCPLLGTCDKYESMGYDIWLKEVKLRSSGNV